MTEAVKPLEWIRSPLGEIVSFQNGFAFKSSTYCDDGAFVIRIGNVQADGISLHNPAYVNIEQLGAEKFMLRCGDMLMSLTGNLGRVATIREKHLPAVLNQRVARLVPSVKMDSRYIYHLTRSDLVQREIQRSAKGAAQLNISTKDLSLIEVVIPPRAEQKAIAEKLDTLLAKVENTKARLERIPKILKRFRQSVLAAAVSGKLTEVLENEFSEIAIEELAKERRYSLGIGPFGSNLKVSDYRGEGYPLVFVREIRAGKFGDGATKFVSREKFDELRAHRVLPGDVLITKMGDPPGDVAIYPVSRPEAVITSDCIKLSVNESVAMTKYVSYAMRSEQFRLSVISISAGVAQQKVNLKKFRKLTLPTPSLEKQAEIVLRVDQLFAYADTIETQVNNALERVSLLTQSILAKAFRGELTEQWRKDNPGLITGDNSAEALLQKIKAQREAEKPVGKARGNSKGKSKA